MFLQSDDISRVARAAKIVERMVNQNTFDDVAQGMCQETTKAIKVLSKVTCNYTCTTFITVRNYLKPP